MTLIEFFEQIKYNSQRQDIIKWLTGMFSWTMIANIIEGAGQLILFILIGRFLSTTDYGIFTTVYMFSTILFLFASLNIQMVINRAVSRTRELATRYLGNGLSIIIASSAIAFLIAFILAGIFYSPAIVILIMILGLYQTLLNITQLYTAVFAANRRMDYLAMLTFIKWSIAIALIVLFLHIMPNLTFISLALLFGSLIQLICAMLLNYMGGFAPRHCLDFDLLLCQKLIKEALPLGASQILGMTYWRVDTILLSILLPHSFAIIGGYSAAYAIFNGANLPGRSIFISTYPVFSRLMKESPHKMRRIGFYSYLAVLGIGLFVVLITYFLGTPLMLILYGQQYLDAKIYIQILAFSSVFRYITYFSYSFLPAIDRSEKYLLAVASAAVLNVTLNLLLIPGLAAVGSAYATVITEFVVAFLGTLFMIRYTPQNKPSSV